MAFSMSEGDRSGAWESALSRSPYRVFPVERSRLVQHWDSVSAHYDSYIVSLIDQHLWDLLLREGTVPIRGQVLDIGCGTGAFTERFARHGARTIGLDISPGMLTHAKERCSSLNNVELVCQDWGSFSSGADHDLVFSSFCPAVDDLSSVLKMESLSRGKCCLVSLGGSRGDRLSFEIWGELGHPGLSLEGFDPIYPYYMLKELGRDPVLRSFDLCEEHEISVEGMVEHFVQNITLFRDLTPEMSGIIRSQVEKRASDGRLTVREERTVSVLTWTVGPGDRNVS